MNGAQPAKRVRRFEVVVIGGGLAGLCAAIAAAERGLKVAVVRRGLGTTAMTSGALDFPARLTALYGDLFDPDQTVVDDAYAEFRQWMAEAGVDLEGRPGETLRLMDVSGNIRESNVAPPGIAEGRLDRWPARGSGRRLLLLGISGYAPFRPEWVGRCAVAEGLLDPDQVVTAQVVVPGSVGGEANLPAARIAQALEQPEAAQRFAAVVVAETVKAGASCVALPPVLGLDPAGRVCQTIAAALTELSLPEEAGAARAFELLSTPPSVPGQRLQRALDTAARSAGVELVSGAVTGWVAATDEVSGGRRITGLRVESGGRVSGLQASEFVLAGGRFVGGGLDGAGGMLREPIFNLTVWVPAPAGWPDGPVPAGRRLAHDLVWERFRARHPVFEAGVAVAGDLRPLDAGRQVALANLRAAGSIIGGYNHLTDGMGSGVAVVTGIEAGRLAAEAAKARHDTTGVSTDRASGSGAAGAASGRGVRR